MSPNSTSLVCTELRHSRKDAIPEYKSNVVVVCGKNPLSLQNCAELTFLRHLVSLCQARDYERNKRALKHFLKFQLPPTVRQRLIQLSLAQGRIYSLIDVNVFELLLSPSVGQIRIQGVRSFYQNQVAAILQQLGTGLESLFIEESSWGPCRREMSLALSKLDSIKVLSLRYLASDSMLNVITKSCGHLQILDVTGSQEVTDQGVKLLCNPVSQLDDEHENCTCHGTRSTNRKTSFPGLSKTSCNDKKSSSFIPAVLKKLRRHSVTRGHVDFVPSRQLSSRDPLGAPTTCLKTLRRFDLTGTNVTVEGLRHLSARAPTLDVITSAL